MNIVSVTRNARTAMTPSPTLGKMQELLVWSAVNRLPSRTSGGNGLPVPIIALPSLQVSRSAGVASAREVGFYSGKITGRALCSAIERTTE